jgi:hypothetical protein
VHIFTTSTSPTNELNKIQFITIIKNSTCLGTCVPSSGDWAHNPLFPNSLRMTPRTHTCRMFNNFYELYRITCILVGVLFVLVIFMKLYLQWKLNTWDYITVSANYISCVCQHSERRQRLSKTYLHKLKASIYIFITRTLEVCIF